MKRPQRMSPLARSSLPAQERKPHRARQDGTFEELAGFLIGCKQAQNLLSQFAIFSTALGDERYPLSLALKKSGFEDALDFFPVGGKHSNPIEVRRGPRAHSPIHGHCLIFEEWDNRPENARSLKSNRYHNTAVARRRSKFESEPTGIERAGGGRRWASDLTLRCGPEPYQSTVILH